MKRRSGAAGGGRSDAPWLLPPPFFFFFFLYCCLCPTTAQEDALQMILPKEEVDALRRIDAKLHVGWNFSVNPCSGAGGWFVPSVPQTQTSKLFCGQCSTNVDTTAGTNLCHVVSIQLEVLNLTGSLPLDFSDLPFLQEILLSRNYINGTFPVAWASLPLVNISLYGNRLTGRLPEEIGNLTTLKILILEDNLFEGPLPASLGNLTNLSKLLLSSNDFSGELPKTLVNLKNLEYLEIDATGISGKIPPYIANWTKLRLLYMQGTSMEGPFPSVFTTLKELTNLRVSDLARGENFPQLQGLPLEHLTLRNCSISGHLPDYIGEMNLYSLDLSFNNFTGGIPSTYVKIKYMYLTNNMLNGTIPSWISERGNYIDLSFNSFSTSSADSCTEGNVNMFASCSSSNNPLLPECLRKNYPCPGQATNNELHINCGGNEVTIGGRTFESDSSPLGASTFFLAENKNWAFSSTGDFLDSDRDLYTIANISVLNITDDVDLYMSARLSPLSLRYYGLCLINGLYTVNLHFAELFFSDDQTFSSLGRRFFEVSAQGRKVLTNFNIAKDAGGNGRKLIKSFEASVEDNTLEIHFQWAGKGTTAIPTRGTYGPLISAISVTLNSSREKLSVGVIIGMVVLSSTISALMMLLWFSLRKRYGKNTELREFRLQTGKFSLRQIKSATGNFDPANKVGEGGFGPVYKGILPDGSLIAVKQLSSNSHQGNREFLTEIGMIYALQHQNVVKLYGCCMEGTQLFLIYEYLENNSLSHNLFGPEGMRLQLNWQVRHKICLGIARGLAYIHEESSLKIVHRDIKTSNILLDKDFNAKISDFGLARLHEEEDSHINTKIAGTVGYMAPEYAIRGYLTDKADVYSFGVVVLEIISGKKNTSFLVKEDMTCLLDWAYLLERQGNLIALVDPVLEDNYSKEEALQLLKLAVTCANPSAMVRPRMSTVVSILEGRVAENPVSTMQLVKESPLVQESPHALLKRIFDDDSVSISEDASKEISMSSSCITKESSSLL